MKKNIVIAIVVLVLGIGAWLVWSMIATESDTGTQGQPTSFPLPSGIGTGTSVGVGMNVTGSNGSPVKVKDFIRNGETVHDTLNPTHYVLAGSLGYCRGDGTCPSGATVTGFSIDYDEAHSFFSILLEEPIRENRLKAEQFLMGRLGVEGVALCSLNYAVYVTSYVNEFYAGQNLGLSFCPGSVAIPE